MTDELPLAAEFPPATREDWLKLVRAALKDRPFERLIAKTYDGIADRAALPAWQRPAGRRTLGALGRAGPRRSSRSRRRQRRGAARTGKRRDRADARSAPARSTPTVTASAVRQTPSSRCWRHLSRCRRDHRLQRQPGNAGHRSPFCRARQSSRHRRVIGVHARQHQPAWRHGGCRRHQPALERTRQDVFRLHRRACGARLPRSVRRSRRADRAQRRRLGGAGARLRHRQRGRLSARPRGPWHRTRCGARHDLFPARRRCRPVPDHRQISCRAAAVGACRGGLRACSRSPPMCRPKPPGA